MPEKPKRRKNKNKRKNKNNRPDNNKANSEVIDQDNVESCSAHINNDEILLERHDVNESIVTGNSAESLIIENQDVQHISSDILSDNADLNNISNEQTLENLQIPKSNLANVEKNNVELQECSTYIVESPEQSLKSKPKLNNAVKSKSLDNDEVTKIVDITGDNSISLEDDSTLAIVDTSNILVSDVESDVEWENTDELQGMKVPSLRELATGTLSITTMPFNVAQCQKIDVSLTPDVETSLKNYLRTLNLSSPPENSDSFEINAEIEHIINREIRHRLRKKALAEDFGLQRLGPPRTLDVIDEEGSGESTKSSRRHSYLNDKKSDNDDLDDDVFEDNNKSQEKIARRTETVFHKPTIGRLIPQQCVLVGAKIKEPEVTEARGNWTMQTIEKLTGAEVVYLTDSSSSTSSLHDYCDETDDGEDTDVSIRMITPTIEITDTENLLKNSFISEVNDQNKSQDENIKDNKNNEHIIKVKYECDKEKSDQNDHEIIVLSTDNIRTNLYVKDLESTEGKLNSSITNDNVASKAPETNNMKENVQKNDNQYDLEIKVLKCELNDAINNLIKEVSDSELNENTNDTFTRQDSSSSVCSSQCTAKYNPTSSSLNDVSNMLHDETSSRTKTDTEIDKTVSVSSHVKDVFDHVTGNTTGYKIKIEEHKKEPSLLRDLCVQKIAAFPYGDKILEELASVSKRLQNITGAFTTENIIGDKIEKSKENSMPYFPLPDISPIEKVILTTKPKEHVPPPVQPRNSSLKKKSRDEDVWTGVPTNTEPVYVCLSPSQKMLMEKTQTVISKDDASQLADMHKKYVDRRGYTEHYTKEKQKDDFGSDVQPVVSLKSQTGSRLLALIRDPTVTGNINTQNQHKSLEQLEKKFTMQQTLKHQNNIEKNSNTFRPIPPPRPKKLGSSFYESDESSDFTDSSLRSMKSERKFFHFSTGNLNKEIEDDISSIQNMHRYYSKTRENLSEDPPRRPSLPKDICDQQMEYIRKKEKEIDAEIQRLESLKNKLPSSLQKIGPKAPLISEKEVIDEKFKDTNNYFISKRRDFFASLSVPEKTEKQFTNKSDPKGKGKLSSLFSSSQEELLREKMYSEYVTQMAQREERKQHKVIKITNTPVSANSKISKSLSSIDVLDSKVNNRIEEEFISKARQRWDKLGIKDPETEDERELTQNVYREPKVIQHKIKVIESGQEKDVRNLPNHLQEFVQFTAKDKEHRTDSSETVMITPTFKARSTSPAVWRPGAPTPPPAPAPAARSPGAPPPPPPPPVWTPGSSPLSGRKSYRPVHFEETPPTRRKFGSSDQNGCTSGSESEGRGLRTSHSAPVTGLNTLSSNTSRLPRAQNPTVTLLQKAREGQIPRGSSYIQEETRLPRDRPSPPRTDPVHALRREYASETDGERSDAERSSRKMADAHNKIEGIGPITKDGMPVSLRSEVKDPSRWYKKMYDTIHKNKYDDDYVTIRYKSRKGQPPERTSSNKSQYAYFDPRSGYLSEPEGGLSRLTNNTWSDYDSDVTSGHRRRTASVQEDRRMNETMTSYSTNNKYSTLASGRASQEVYKSQPGRIENYVPGKSSVVDKEAKQWWDEVMDIFDGQNISSTTSLPQASPKEKKDITSAILSKSNMARALKESGYESDSTLIFRRRDDTEGPLSPAERRAAYRDLQAGGEPPLRGFRSPAPPRQESPRRYVESDVNIHYRCPVRHDPLPLVPEKELARQQAEHMKRLYREQRRNKYLQENEIRPSDIEAFDASMKELQDMQNRRHQDNFTPSQKNILPLNRYDEAERVIAKALYTFNGQTSRELSFRKGDIIHVRRQIDQNWYEGEIHGRIGLFPYNYVEILKGDTSHAPKKPAIVEGRARAKFDFTAQTNLELPLKKGEVVVLTRRIDQNWWEGRNGNKTGIFPDSYVTILQEPSQNISVRVESQSASDKPVASPAAHGLMNGSARRSMGAHNYTPLQNNPALSNAPPATQPLPGYTTKSGVTSQSASERGYGPPATTDLNNTAPLYVDTNAEAVPYRAMYKYRPQNPDELELSEGDTVYVLEQCDDGWYVGSSQRTGRFGTFPGNYVERI